MGKGDSNFTDETEDFICEKTQTHQITTTTVFRAWDVPFLENVVPSAEDEIKCHSWQDLQYTTGFTNAFYRKEECSIPREVGKLILKLCKNACGMKKAITFVIKLLHF